MSTLACRIWNRPAHDFAACSQRSPVPYHGVPRPITHVKRRVEHHAITEEVLLRMIRTDILGSAPNPALPLQLHGKDGVVVGDRRSLRQNQNFEFRGAYTTAASVLDSFLARRADTLYFVRRTKDALHCHAAPSQQEIYDLRMLPMLSVPPRGSGGLRTTFESPIPVPHAKRRLTKMFESKRECLKYVAQALLLAATATRAVAFPNDRRNPTLPPYPGVPVRLKPSRIPKPTRDR